MINLTGPLLALIVFLPFASIIPILMRKDGSHNIAIATSAIVLVLTMLVALLSRLPGQSGFNVPYIGYLGVTLGFQLNQFSLVLLVMTAIVFFAAALVGSYFIKQGQSRYNMIFAIAEGSCLAIFISANLFLFYVFWELAEVMMFFIIFIYGGYGRRYAAMKFIVYSLASSLLLLIAIMLIYTNVTPHTFDIATIVSNAATIPRNMQFGIIVLLFLSFMIKMPVFPFHTWLPDAHTEAPTTGSMILAGVLLKFGGYGLLLMFLMLPSAAGYAKFMAVLFGLSAIYAAFAAMRQTNIKRMIAYTSITDMAVVGIGAAAFNAFGSNGALYAMLSHGLIVSLLFLVAGVLAEVYGTLESEKIKGVIRNFPAITYLFVFGTVALVGLPLTAGFIGELLTFFGAFTTFGIVGLLPLAGVLLLGVTLFWKIERVFFSRKETSPYGEINRVVILSGLVLGISSVVFGILPSLLLH